MRNKKISKLVDPSFRLYFLVGFLFAAVTVRVSIPLAICEAAAMAFLWWYFRHTAQKRREGIRQYIDDVTDDMTTADKASMLSAPFAMMVFRPDTQEILWSNDSFMQLTGVREDIFDNRIDDILPDFPTHWLLEGKSECPETVVMGGRHFRVFGNLSHPSSRRGGQSLLATTYWTDVTEQDSLREENESRRPIVSVIVIDNYEELMKAGSEASRSAVLAAIDEKISTWLKDSHSLLRKFDRNRYVLVTTEQEYQKLLEGKFSVLDAVRSVVTEDGVAATLSIGVGKDVDDYETLYQNAMLSIEMQGQVPRKAHEGQIPRDGQRPRRAHFRRRPDLRHGPRARGHGCGRRSGRHLLHRAQARQKGADRHRHGGQRRKAAAQ